MYYPYLRGRQYELLALKELAQKQLIDQNVVPVVEPVKVSSTFLGTLQVYKDNRLPLALVLNSQVVELADGDTDSIFSGIGDSVSPALIMNDSAETTMSEAKTRGINEDQVIAILTKRDYLDDYRDIFSKVSPKLTLFSSDERSIRRAISRNKVIFEDKFNRQDKNADYLKNEDEFFSDDHLYYADEGCSGFGDYSIIGDHYEESGFAPRAVVIHIVYFDKKMELRVHHFVSDTNHGIEDVAGKYYEAVTKLKNWYNEGQESQCTDALSVFLNHADKGYYPGLPTIKKLAIMHHLELVNRFLTGGI